MNGVRKYIEGGNPGSGRQTLFSFFVNISSESLNLNTLSREATKVRNGEMDYQRKEERGSYIER